MSLHSTATAGSALHLERLLVEVGEGSKRAFAELYDLVAARVLGIVRRTLIDPAQSEEVTQDVFLEVWQTARRFDAARGRALSWVLTMANRRAIDRVRASQASRDRDLRVGMRDREVDFDHVVEAVEISSRYQAAKAAFAGLSALQREVIELAYEQGFTAGEIASKLDIPLGTVKTRIRDGLLRLRAELIA